MLVHILLLGYDKFCAPCGKGMAAVLVNRQRGSPPGPAGLRRGFNRELLLLYGTTCPRADSNRRTPTFQAGAKPSQLQERVLDGSSHPDF